MLGRHSVFKTKKFRARQRNVMLGRHSVFKTKKFRVRKRNVLSLNVIVWWVGAFSSLHSYIQSILEFCSSTPHHHLPLLFGLRALT
jgi:hypothetical protein